VTDQAKSLVCDLTLPGCWIGGSFDRTRRPKITDFRIELFSICSLESGVSKIGHLRPPNTKNTWWTRLGVAVLAGSNSRPYQEVMFEADQKEPSNAEQTSRGGCKRDCATGQARQLRSMVVRRSVR